MTRRDIDTARIAHGWDQLVRFAASIQGGWISAVTALARLGSDARGDPVHVAGTHLGQLCRTVYLCDYYTNAVFRREILKALNQGELVNALKREIYWGVIAAKRGRHPEQLSAISGGLSILANLTMGWVTSRLQGAIDSRAHAGQAVPDEVVAHLSPVHFDRVNYRGRLLFPVHGTTAMYVLAEGLRTVDGRRG